MVRAFSQYTGFAPTSVTANLSIKMLWDKNKILREMSPGGLEAVLRDIGDKRLIRLHKS